MSDDSRDSDRAPKKRPSWRDMLGRSARYSKTLEPSKRAARNVESGNERNDPPTTSGIRENERNSGQSPRPGAVGSGEQAPGGIDEDDDITGVIEVNLAEARRLVDELCKKEK